MIDKNDPITMAIVSAVVSFALLVGILYLANPIWVQVINQQTGKGEISWSLIVSYSATFAFVCAIAVLLFISQYRTSSNTQTSAYTVPVALPPPEIASAFCGTK